MCSVVETNPSWAAVVARLTLGLVMFPHAAQKVLGWFGGAGLAATYASFTEKIGLAPALAAAAIAIELCASIMLIFGLLTRVAAVGIMVVMAGAIATVHLPYGFFMNWWGTQAGEGFEYHLLAIGLAVVAAILGGGKCSIDRVLMRRRPAEGGSIGERVTES
ncbi:MAG: DoxX family protein [Labilithrix sp.]|nr:DoxX family protein [Labilithrix sp.]